MCKTEYNQLYSSKNSIASQTKKKEKNTNAYAWQIHIESYNSLKYAGYYNKH